MDHANSTPTPTAGDLMDAIRVTRDNLIDADILLEDAERARNWARRERDRIVAHLHQLIAWHDEHAA